MRNNAWAALIIVFGIIGWAMASAALFITVETPDGEVIEGNLFRLEEGAGITIAGDDGTNTITITSSASAPDTFNIVDVPNGTNPAASGASTLTLTEGTNILITGDSGTDTVTIGVTGSQTKSITIGSPSISLTDYVQFQFAQDSTVTRIACSTNTGTAEVQFDERSEITPNTPGVDLLTSTLICDDDTEVSNTFNNDAITAFNWVNVQLIGVTGSDVLRIGFAYEP